MYVYRVTTSLSIPVPCWDTGKMNLFYMIANKRLTPQYSGCCDNPANISRDPSYIPYNDTWMFNSRISTLFLKIRKTCDTFTPWYSSLSNRLWPNASVHSNVFLCVIAHIYWCFWWVEFMFIKTYWHSAAYNVLKHPQFSQCRMYVFKMNLLYHSVIYWRNCRCSLLNSVIWNIIFPRCSHAVLTLCN